MGIVITSTKRGYRYTCDCGYADILVEGGDPDDGYYCLNCDAWRSIRSCHAERKLRIAQGYFK